MGILKIAQQLEMVVGSRVWPIMMGIVLISFGAVVWLLNNRIATVQDENHLLQEANAQLKQSGAQAIVIDPSIRIASHQDNDIVGSVFDLSGVYGDLPPDNSLRVFVRHDDATGIFPQDMVEYEQEEKIWRARVDIGNLPGEPVTVFAALVGKDGQALYAFYFKVGRATGQWVGLDALTRDIIEVDSVRVVHN